MIKSGFEILCYSGYEDFYEIMEDQQDCLVKFPFVFLFSGSNKYDIGNKHVEFCLKIYDTRVYK
jgi:hypothetical protein